MTTAPSPLAPDWAFVVQLREGMPIVAEHLQGRIEHVTSGKATAFESLERALEFMRIVLSEVSAKLPATGRYLVVVAEEPRFARGIRFTGNYCVTLESSLTAWRSFEATAWVELVMPHQDGP